MLWSPRNLARVLTGLATFLGADCDGQRGFGIFDADSAEHLLDEATTSLLQTSHYVHDSMQDATSTAARTRRVHSIADIHGDTETSARLLREIGVMNEEGAWIGGRDVLVQIGDLAAYGPNTKGSYDMMLRLRSEAARSGGEVILLFGNTDVLELRCGNTFSHAEASSLIDTFQAVALLGAEHGLDHPVVFVHAALRGYVLAQFPEMSPHAKVAAINKDFRALLRTKIGNCVDDVDPTTDFPGWAIELTFSNYWHDEGPYWKAPAIPSLCGEMVNVLHSLGAARVVGGHGIDIALLPEHGAYVDTKLLSANNSVRPHCGGRALWSDTGSFALNYGGRASSLEYMSNGSVRVTYLAGSASSPATVEELPAILLQATNVEAVPAVALQHDKLALPQTGS